MVFETRILKTHHIAAFKRTRDHNGIIITLGLTFFFLRRDLSSYSFVPFHIYDIDDDDIDDTSLNLYLLVIETTKRFLKVHLLITLIIWNGRDSRVDKLKTDLKAFNSVSISKR